MRALVIHGAKDLRIEERDEPAVKAGQVKIRLATGGICGSDLHYYNHGGFGTIRLKEPMVLGHEFSGFVSELGEGVKQIAIGDLVAVSPSRPCYKCCYCNEGLHNQCLNMRFYGSAMPFPHIQGGFQEELVVQAEQCVNASGISSAEAAMAEPFAVVLHAARRAGEILGKRVLITGCGPIGALAVVAARRAGAAEIVVTDITSNALEYAELAGADRTINTGQNKQALEAYYDNKGHFDVLFECSGSPQALAGAIPAIRPRGVIMQLGLSGDMPVPMMQITAKELDLRGSFRFHEEFGLAVKLMQKKLVDLKPLISHTFPIEQAVEAFEVAANRETAMKAHIVFSNQHQTNC